MFHQYRRLLGLIQRVRAEVWAFKPYLWTIYKHLPIECIEYSLKSAFDIIGEKGAI